MYIVIYVYINGYLHCCNTYVCICDSTASCLCNDTSNNTVQTICTGPSTAPCMCNNEECMVSVQ